MIRAAIPEDATAVAPLMFQAMEEIVYKMIGRADRYEGIGFLELLFAKGGNQYSYENAWVYEDERGIVGSVVAYDGGELYALRLPVLELIKERYGTEIVLEDETGAGELYIDTLSVLPLAQGNGIGSALINHLKGLHRLPLGLLVDVNNAEAERLYNRLGFVYANQQALAGGVYKHLVLF